MLKQSITQWEQKHNLQVDDSMLDPDQTKMTLPDFHMAPQNILDEPVEKPVLFSGVIGDVPAHMDITNRTDVLRIIDKGKKQGLIPTHATYEYHAAILSLSTYNIKIIKANGEDLLLRVPMHEIAAMCYIKDDKQHILAIKFGTPEMCQLAVMYCDNKNVAEELCSLVEYCFQMIYLKGVIGFFDVSINNPSGSPSTGGSTTIPKAPLSVSETASDYTSSNMQNSDSRSIRSIGGELLTDYMSKLHKELNPRELQQFAQILPDMENRFPEFCEKVLRLYGTERKHLLKEMMPFIPADNLTYFEDFLSRNGILSSISNSYSNMRSYSTRRSIGEVSTTSSISNNPTTDESLHHLLELSESKFNSVDVDTDPAKYVPNVDYNVD